MKKIFFILIIFAACFASVSAQQVIVYPAEDPVFSISFPEDWIVNLDEESISATPSDSSISFNIIALGAADIDSAIAYADLFLSDMFQDLELDDPISEEYNGLNFLSISGSGTDESGTEIYVDVELISDNEGQYFMLFYFGTPDSETAHDQEIQFIDESITKVK